MSFFIFLNNCAVSTEWICPNLFNQSTAASVIQFGSGLCYHDRLNKICLFLIPQTCDYVTSMAKGTLLVCELRMAKWGEWLYYSGGPKVINHKHLHKRKRAKSALRRRMWGWKEAGAMRGQVHVECGKLLEAGEVLGMNSSPRASERTGLQFQFCWISQFCWIDALDFHPPEL